MNVNWRRVCEKKATEDTILKVEKLLNITLPEHFIECVKKYEGCFHINCGYLYVH
jgi:hypothetical protein